MSKGVRPNLIKRFNVRRNCNLKCNDRCINLISEQTQTLNTISKHIQTITIITVANFITPLILIGAAGISDLINKIMH